ncbi:protein of unknown function [Cupriavidus taiwanensis]|nr:protein of unknown function [Cupriavidus taiwanensis]
MAGPAPAPGCARRPRPRADRQPRRAFRPARQPPRQLGHAVRPDRRRLPATRPAVRLRLPGRQPAGQYRRAVCARARAGGAPGRGHRPAGAPPRRAPGRTGALGRRCRPRLPEHRPRRAARRDHARRLGPGRLRRAAGGGRGHRHAAARQRQAARGGPCRVQPAVRPRRLRRAGSGKTVLPAAGRLNKRHGPRPATAYSLFPPHRPLPPAPLPRCGGGEQTCGRPSPPPPKPPGLHLDRRSDSRTAPPPEDPVSRTVRRNHFIFSFAFNGLQCSCETFVLARRVQYRPPLTAPDRYAGTPPASRPMPKKQRRTHP